MLAKKISLILLVLLTSFLSFGQSDDRFTLLVLDPLQNPVQGATIYACGQAYYTLQNGTVQIPNECDDVITIHCIGFKDLRLDPTEVKYNLTYTLSYEKEELNQVSISADKVDIKEKVENLIDHSWSVYKDYFNQPLPTSYQSWMVIDNDTHSVSIDTMLISNYSNREWIPFPNYKALSYSIDFGNNSDRLLKYSRRGNHSEVEWHFPLHPLDWPLGDIENSQVRIIDRSEQDSTETFVITSEFHHGIQYEVLLKSNFEKNLILSTTKRIKSYTDSSLNVGLEGVTYVSPYTLVVDYEFISVDGKYLLKTARMQREYRIHDELTGEFFNCIRYFEMQTHPNWVVDGTYFRDVHTAIYFPSWRTLEKWINAIQP